MRQIRRQVMCALLALAGVACEGHPRVIGDGWHYGESAVASRALGDSLLGLSEGAPSVAYVGIERAGDSGQLVMRPSGGLTGESWASAFVAMRSISVVVGHPGSSATNAAARRYAEAGVPLIVPNATARSTPEIEEWVFRLLPDDATQGAFLAHYALDSLQAERVAVVFVGDAYGVGILRGVRAALAGRGRPLADEVEIPLGSCNANPLAPPRLATRAMLQRARPDAVIIALPLTPANCVIDEVSRANQNIALVGADALDEVQLDRWARANAPDARLRIATAWQPRDDAATRHFVEAFARRHGARPRGAEVLHYDAVLVAATALRETSGSPARVREWLAALGVTREPVQGLTGPISFAPDRAVRLYMRTVN